MLHHQALTKWDTSRISSIRNGTKISQAPTWRSEKTGRFFSLADCTSDATSNCNREKPNLSSLPPTIKHALHRVSPFFFMPFLALSQAETQRRLSSSYPGMSTMSRGLRAFLTKNSDPRHRHFFHLGSDGYYHFVSFSFISFFGILSVIVKKTLSRMYWIIICRAILISVITLIHISAVNNMITFHISISLIQRTIWNDLTFYV